jgi:hypothetical protein
MLDSLAVPAVSTLTSKAQLDGLLAQRTLPTTDPEIVPIDLAVAGKAWLDSLRLNGVVVVDSKGRFAVPEQVKRLLDALHEVAAGGSIEVTTLVPGDQALKRELNAKFEDAIAQTNTLITDLGAEAVYP